MEVAPSAEVIRATQDSLGKFVKRPPLTEKLLKKPPFRFLHDIITSVLKSNGFFEGLFEETELISENVKDREAKMLFLTKVISILNLTTGKTLTVKPSKIISGQEPEKTNELLQCLGFALEKKLSTDEAVKKYKQNTNAKINKKSQDELSKKLPKHEKNQRERNTLKSKSNETLTKQADKKDGNKDKRENSISRTQDKKNNKDTSTSRKDNQKDKPEIIKEKTKIRDRSITKQKSSEKIFKVSPPKQNLTDKIESNNLQISDNEVDVQDNNFEINEPELITSNSNLKNEDVDDVTNGPAKGLVHTADGKSESKHTAIENSSSNHNLNDNDDDVNALMKPTTINEEQPPINPELNISQNMNNEHNTGNSAKDDEIAPTILDNKTDIETETVTAFQINNEITSKYKESMPQANTTTTYNLSEITHNVESNKSVGLGNKPGTPMVTSRSNFLRPPSSRPPSSRPGAPRLRDKHDSLLSATENSPVGKVHVIVENGEMDAEEDEASLVFVEPQIEQELEDSGTEKDVQNPLADHGHLVQQILDSQKEFNQTQTGKTAIEWEFGAQRARQASSQEVEQLRFNLQALSRAANPLGKLLDHIQEDVEVMRQELQQWTKTYEDSKAQLAKEKRATEQALQPLQAKSKQLEEEITDKRDKINDLKSIIHKNSARIDKLLANGNVQ